jgi:gamma-butyrobetaine dioxygenase
VLDVLDVRVAATRRVGPGPSSNALNSRVEEGRLVLQRDGDVAVLHPLWIRERSLEAGAADPTNHQRLVEPLDVAPDLRVTAAIPAPDGGIDVLFSDGHRMTLSPDAVSGAFDGVPDGEPPAPEAWLADDVAVPTFDYRPLGGTGSCGAELADEALLTILDRFFRHGWFLLRNTPAVAGALHEITAHFGRISATNFGTLFDVRTEPVPADLAYTPFALSAHTDQPYRRPAPALQFLHTVANGAPGGASTVVDGLAAVNTLAAIDPEAYEVLTTLLVEFRYDIGTDVKVRRAPLIELRPNGSLQQLRYSPRLDFAPAIEPDVLDAYYRGRRWLAAELNSPHRQIEVRMEAGDVLVVDNHRVLHGRTAFDPSRGSRHLQGCYIDHDGPETAWRLAMRRTTAGR